MMLTAFAGSLRAATVEPDDASAPAGRMHRNGATRPRKRLGPPTGPQTPNVRRSVRRKDSRFIPERLYAAARVGEPEGNDGQTTPAGNPDCALSGRHDVNPNLFMCPIPRCFPSCHMTKGAARTNCRAWLGRLGDRCTTELPTRIPFALEAVVNSRRRFGCTMTCPITSAMSCYSVLTVKCCRARSAGRCRIRWPSHCSIRW